MTIQSTETEEIIRLKEELDELAVKLKRRQESLQFLQLITKTYVSLVLTKSSAICDTLISLMSTFLEVEHGAALLEESEGGTLQVASFRGFEGREDMTSPVALEMWRWVMEEKVPRFVSAEDLNARWPSAPPFLRSGFACVSIDIQDRSVGLLLAANKISGRGFSELDLEFMAGAAGIGAMALMYCSTHGALQRLIQEVEQQSEEKERVALDELDRKAQIIERQKSAIRELSTPILILWDDVLALPIVGQIDSARAEQMTESLLYRIVESGSRCVIIDATGVEIIDTSTAGHFVKMMEAARLLGSYCVVTGIGPEIAKTMVALDLDFGSVMTLRNLKEGLKHCLAYLSQRSSDEKNLAR